MPYMGYTPDGMMASMAPISMPGLTSAAATAATSAAAATSSPQRKDLVAKAKNQRLGESIQVPRS